MRVSSSFRCAGNPTDSGPSGFAAAPEERLVLIIGDEDPAWDLVYCIVRREGFRTAAAAGAGRALDMARGLRPALILLDMTLRGGDWLGLVRELQRGDTSGIPVMLLEGRGLPRYELARLMIEPNLKGFMVKPFNYRHVVDTLHKMLNTRPRPAPVEIGR